jgi:hypothetical protein
MKLLDACLLLVALIGIALAFLLLSATFAVG